MAMNKIHSNTTYSLVSPVNGIIPAKATLIFIPVNEKGHLNAEVIEGNNQSHAHNKKTKKSGVR